MVDNNEFRKPKFIRKRTIKEIIKLYPTVQKRGWTEEFLISLVENDVIGGDNTENGITIIFEDSFRHFLEYHDAYYRRRIESIKENIKAVKSNRKFNPDNEENA